MVAVALENFGTFGNACEERRLNAEQVEAVAAKFAMLRRADDGAVVGGPHLEAEANAEYRGAELVDGGVEGWVVGGRGGSAGDDNAGGAEALDVLGGHL